MNRNIITENTYLLFLPYDAQFICTCLILSLVMRAVFYLGRLTFAKRTYNIHNIHTTTKCIL